MSLPYIAIQQQHIFESNILLRNILKQIILQKYIAKIPSRNIFAQLNLPSGQTYICIKYSFQKFRNILKQIFFKNISSKLSFF